MNSTADPATVPVAPLRELAEIWMGPAVLDGKPVEDPMTYDDPVLVQLAAEALQYQLCGRQLSRLLDRLLAQNETTEGEQ